MYGNARAVIKEPRFPAIFIVPDTAPDLRPPISMQNVQLGAMVISTPNMAMLKVRIKANGVESAIWVLSTRPTTPMEKPMTAGTRREATRYPLLYRKLTRPPADQCAIMPRIRGMGL